MARRRKKIALMPCLWFNKDAEAAAKFYAKTFPNSRVLAIHKSPSDYPNGRAGDVITVEFTVLGQSFVGLNGGPGVEHTDGVSFQVLTDTQAETDRYWKALTQNGGKEVACGWCVDRFGVHWQITPRALVDGFKDPNKMAAKRVMDAMMKMVKIDIATIKAARRG